MLSVLLRVYHARLEKVGDQVVSHCTAPTDIKNTTTKNYGINRKLRERKMLCDLVVLFCSVVVYLCLFVCLFYFLFRFKCFILLLWGGEFHVHHFGLYYINRPHNLYERSVSYVLSTEQFASYRP